MFCISGQSVYCSGQYDALRDTSHIRQKKLITFRKLHAFNYNHVMKLVLKLHLVSGEFNVTG